MKKLLTLALLLAFPLVSPAPPIPPSGMYFPPGTNGNICVYDGNTGRYGRDGGVPATAAITNDIAATNNQLRIDLDAQRGQSNELFVTRDGSIAVSGDLTFGTNVSPLDANSPALNFKGKGNGVYETYSMLAETDFSDAVHLSLTNSAGRNLWRFNWTTTQWDFEPSVNCSTGFFARAELTTGIVGDPAVTNDIANKAYVDGSTNGIPGQVVAATNGLPESVVASTNTLPEVTAGKYPKDGSEQANGAGLTNLSWDTTFIDCFPSNATEFALAMRYCPKDTHVTNLDAWVYGDTVTLSAGQTIGKSIANTTTNLEAQDIPQSLTTPTAVALDFTVAAGEYFWQMILTNGGSTNMQNSWQGNQ